MKVDIAQIRFGNRWSGEFIKLADLYLMPSGVVAVATNYELALPYFDANPTWVSKHLGATLKSLNEHKGERLGHRLRFVMPDNGLAMYYDKLSSISIESAQSLLGFGEVMK